MRSQHLPRSTGAPVSLPARVGRGEERGQGRFLFPQDRKMKGQQAGSVVSTREDFPTCRDVGKANPSGRHGRLASSQERI